MSQLELAVERRKQHNMKCRKRNVNTCKMCHELYEDLCNVYKETKDSDSPKLSVLLAKSDVMRG